MTLLELWQYKVLQTLHDPIHKIAIQGRLSHVEAGRRLVEAVTAERKKLPFRAPDRLATGADRPVVGSGKTCFVHWPTSPTLTHPLQPGIRLEVEWDLLAAPDGAKKAAARELHERVHDAHLPLALPAGGWDSEASVRRLLLQLWRLAPEMLRDAGLQAPYLPADSRCPDHSVWDHTRIAAAAAYIEEIETKRRSPDREPWMLAFTLGGVQRFLRESRKTRDLWTASMIYADLAWAAMRPVVEALGPDAILYPDLRGNPSADRWLLDTAPDAVPAAVSASGATSYAAMLPNTFAALMPRGGGDSGLPDLVELAHECTRAVGERWRELAGAVEGWLKRRAGTGTWQEIWKRQIDGGLGEPPVAWVAIPWPRRMYGLGEAARGPALPGQSADASSLHRPEQLETREQALSPWLPSGVWRHYELARDVFWHAHAGYLTDERGFDYPLVHRQLRAALAMRKAAAQPRAQAEPGEKCCLTGREEVLSDAEAGSGPRVARRRQGARNFWARFDSEGRGAERLGSTGAVKRFLVQADEPAFTATWESREERQQRGDFEPRVPFPSTAAIVAASFLEDLAAKASHPPVAAAIRSFVAAFAESGLEESVDPRCLAALARSARGPGMARMLAIEPEYLFPEALEILVRTAPESQSEGREAFRQASVNLRKATADAHVPPPRKLVAILRMDGDALGQLILGDPQAIPTTWRDVLHPQAVEQVLEKLSSDGWPGLLDERRHMGPALHAAVSRSLADFAHKMVAWVVEREFNGRLVYAGGDDLLALLPAVEAVPAAARLQQLFSASYVLDTDADADPWSWRRGDMPGSPEEARRRFRVPVARQGTIRLSEPAFEDHAAGDLTPSELPKGRGVALYPMLGRGQSLSAGIAIAHYKTPLSLLLETAGDLLEREAKERMGRSAAAVALLARSGTKAVFASKWRVREASDSGSEGRSEVEPEPPDVQLHLDRVIAAFGRSPRASDPSAGARLPGRVPYKLRQSIELTGRVLLDSAVEAAPLVQRLVALESGLSGDRPRDVPLIESVTGLVQCGLRYGKGRDGQPVAGRLSQAAVAGLLLARRLANDGDIDGPA